MDSFFTNWFRAFDKGLNRMSEQECSRLFSECASQCAKDAIKHLYGDLFAACEGNLDAFFRRLNEVDGVDGGVIEEGGVYEIIFESCSCDLHTQAQMDSSKLCECSRQSILHELKELVPDRTFCVEKLESILDGAPKCRFLITDNSEVAVSRRFPHR